MGDYGLSVYRYGVVIRTDGRVRWRSPEGDTALPGPLSQKSREIARLARRRMERRVAGFSERSRKHLEFIAANVAASFRSLLTLTYHAPGESWDDPDRNLAVALRSKRDLNRFLCALRRGLGRYVWVQEFQARGVVHFHVLSERDVSEDRARWAWLRATGELDDGDAFRYAVKVEAVRNERQARGYLGRYVGKAQQKTLPPGVEAAGRWWGRSRSLALELVEQIVSCRERGRVHDPGAAQVLRCVRRYMRRRLGFKYRSGRLLDWGGQLAGEVERMVPQLRKFFGAYQGTPDGVESFGWERVEEVGHD